MATAAQQSDSNVLGRVGSSDGMHPQIVKVLARAAPAIALGQISQRVKT